ncbi:hypothetical protein [Deinococcus planocerae]|uniref:hypothetical protein n=1 Tax=Deinococcus planocerae TaxID=1737569 RepID=UPI001FE786B6|nr:hypothetical protein [Deinococcus planocerae]
MRAVEDWARTRPLRPAVRLLVRERLQRRTRLRADGLFVGRRRTGGLPLLRNRLWRPGHPYPSPPARLVSVSAGCPPSAPPAILPPCAPCPLTPVW